MGKLVFALVLMAVIWWLFFARKGRPKLRDDEARQVLGVSANADAAAIRAAHRRLITAVHPDKGGSVDLTKRINAARDVLLKRLR
ncbi:DnaJ domain-containing protein [Sphingomonas qomolangmaensis]|uniref:DnaJ domain-containing protein n=1 Tax=Sphingomonas qomolangmaensis TaxID=2918765 RepID=A0ABY5L3K2_9SPHN|nr:DnaJ domain-containing protein [Sphingomonas qomolangmaensis]UUL81545.1 DnaJ domain-containing protein [Sphingomonas qomolangmaensis]